ncbi:signal transduction histidine kinase [Hymenobacter sp. UYAg731]
MVPPTLLLSLTAGVRKALFVYSVAFYGRYLPAFRTVAIVGGWLLGLCSVLPRLAAAQSQPSLRRIDSLKLLLHTHPQPDTTRIKLLFDLSDELMEVDVSAVGAVRRETLLLARRLRYRDFLAEALLNIADYHIALAQYDSAGPPLEASRREFARLHDLGGQMRNLGRLARMADQQGHLAEALDYCLRGMAISSTGNERRFHTSLKIHAASLYTRLGEFGPARQYLQEALATARYHDYPDRLNRIMAELGELNRAQGHWAEARRFYGMSIAVSRQIAVADQATVRTMRFHLADVTERLGDHTAAQVLARATLHEATAAHDVLLVPQLLALLGRTWLHQGRPDSALTYAERGRQASARARAPEGLRAAYEVLALAHAAQGNWAAAYQDQRRFEAYNNRLNGAAVSRRTAALRFNHAAAQHRAELQLLGQQQELARLRRQRLTAGLLGLGLLAAVGGAALLWRYRQRQRRRETALRTTLAADLHDDVGTLLSQIARQSSLLQDGLADAAGQRQQLGEITEASRAAGRQLNDVLWSLDTHHDRLPDLLDRMRDYAEEVLGRAGLEVTFDFPADLPDQRLSVLLRRNLYLIYKESLHNVLKHATGATAVAVRLRYMASSLPQLVLEVRDNAPSPAVTEAGAGRPPGHGLRNMATRAEALVGAAIAGPVAAGGFRVQVAVPLPRARHN